SGSGEPPGGAGRLRRSRRGSRARCPRRGRSRGGGCGSWLRGLFNAESAEEPGGRRGSERQTWRIDPPETIRASARSFGHPSALRGLCAVLSVLCVEKGQRSSREGGGVSGVHVQDVAGGLARGIAREVVDGLRDVLGEHAAFQEGAVAVELLDLVVLD